MRCHFRDCKRPALPNGTTCARHYSAGMTRKQWARAHPHDDWEGPPAPEYPESDPEAYDEMVREDMEGKS